jgi:hypothetical protein
MTGRPLLLACVLVWLGESSAWANPPATPKAPSAPAQPDKPKPPGEADKNANPKVAAPWDLQRVELANGRVYLGWIEAEDNQGLDFLQILRPQGKGTYAVGLRIARSQIASIDRLSDEQRKALSQRVRQFRNRENIEAAALRDLIVTANNRNGRAGWQYDGQWFRLESTAAEDTTRRSILKMEQMFAAYQLMLPPKTQPKSPPRVLLWGSMTEYRDYLKLRGLTIDHPAFFSPSDNLIVAGSELGRYASELTKIRAKHDELLKRYKELDLDLTKQLQANSEDFKKQGAAKADLQRVNLLARRKFADEVTAVGREVAKVDRENARLFDEVTRQMFSTLDHEAFHAYLENYVYPHDRFDVPRWLNEGLAQVFADGLLEVGELRIDAPRSESLSQLQDDLRGKTPLSLEELLSADPRLFLVTHRSNAAADGGRGIDASRRHYLYSWGVAYYLMTQQHILGTKALDKYVSPEAKGLPPVARFQQLVGMPLAEFETQWREWMLGVKTRRK